MSIPSRGYLAAGLAVAVVGSLGVFALNAGADEVTNAPAPAAAAASVDPDAPSTDADVAAPPPVLPWGAKPKPLTKGPAGATGRQLAAMGADIAPTRSRRGLRVDSPKGFVSPRHTLRSSRTTVPPQPPAVAKAAAAPAAEPRQVRFHYSVASQKVESEGTHANLVIPAYDKTAPPGTDKLKLGPNDYHTLAEIAVQSADERQVVEVGWTIDRLLNGNDEPHLFVYHWVDNGITCYNTCGFVRWGSSDVGPGGALPTGTAKKFGIQFSGVGWWVAYDTDWIGYFPATNWGGRFTKAGMHQWFGEVASSTLDPCSSMGTGATAYDAVEAARIGSITLLGADEPVSVKLDVSSKYTDKDGRERERDGGPAYTGVRVSDRTIRFGGPAIKEVAAENGTQIPNPACTPK